MLIKHIPMIGSKNNYSIVSQIIFIKKIQNTANVIVYTFHHGKIVCQRFLVKLILVYIVLSTPGPTRTLVSIICDHRFRSFIIKIDIFLKIFLARYIWRMRIRNG